MVNFLFQGVSKRYYVLLVIVAPLVQIFSVFFDISQFSKDNFVSLVIHSLVVVADLEFFFDLFFELVKSKLIGLELGVHICLTLFNAALNQRSPFLELSYFILQYFCSLLVSGHSIMDD